MLAAKPPARYINDWSYAGGAHYDSGQLTPIDSGFHRDSDWVSYGLVIYGQESTQTLVVRFAISTSAAAVAEAPPAVAPAVAVQSPFGLWGASVPAGGGSPAPQANIEPQAAVAGAQFRAYARGFQNDEPISIWLNTPGGVQALDGSFAANSAGEVWPEFSSDELAPGSYGLVIYGRSSGQTIVVPFAING